MKFVAILSCWFVCLGSVHFVNTARIRKTITKNEDPTNPTLDVDQNHKSKLTTIYLPFCIVIHFGTIILNLNYSFLCSSNYLLVPYHMLPLQIEYFSSDFNRQKLERAAQLSFQIFSTFKNE